MRVLGPLPGFIGWVHGIQGCTALRALNPWLPSVTPPGSIGSASPFEDMVAPPSRWHVRKPDAGVTGIGPSS